MTTSLAQQLKKLAVPQSSIYTQDKKKTSLLFDPKEAASIDRETFYEIGLSGLNELKILNESFAEYETTLFSISSKDFERAIQTKKANEKINLKIKSFLLKLSPYFLLQSSHKALEWLINRFHIHKYNIDDILQLILPYHETKIFIRFLQILKINNATDTWNWLEPLQKPGIPLAKSVLFNHCISCPSLLKFISDSVIISVDTFGSKANLLTTLFAFYCTTTIGALEYAPTVTEPLVTNILPGLLKSLTSDIDDFRAAGYMITAQLVSKTQLKSKVAKHIINTVLCINKSLQYEAVLLVQIVFQTQNSVVTITESSLSNITTNCIKEICLNMNLLINGGSDVSKFIQAFMTGVLQCVQKNSECLKRFASIAEAIVSEINLNPECAVILIKCAIDSYETTSDSNSNGPASDMEILEEDDDFSDSVKIQKWYTLFLKTIEQKYPTEFDSVLKEELRNNQSLSDKRRSALNDILGFAPKLSQKLGTSFLFEKLYHQNSDMRTEAVKFLVMKFNDLKKNDIKFLRDSIIDRFNDDEPNVVSTILKLNLDILLNLLGEDILKDQLILIINNGLKHSAWWAPAGTALEYLCSIDNIELDLRTCFAVIPYLFPRDDIAASLTLKVIKSPLGNVIFSDSNISKISQKSNPKYLCKTIFNIIKNGEWLPSTADIIKAMNVSHLEDNYTSKIVALMLLSFSIRDERSPVKNLEVLNEAIKFTDNLKMVSNQELSNVSGDTIVDFFEMCKDDILPLQCLTLVIEKIILNTDLTGLTKPWIDFSKSSDANIFLSQIYEVIIINCDKKYVRVYSPLFSHLIHSVNSTLRERIEFICNFIIGDNQDIEDTHNIKKSQVSQIRSLKILHTLLQNTEENLLWILDSNITIVSILISLNCPISTVRSITLDIINVLRTKIGLSGHYNAILLDELSSRQEEIQLDHEQLPQLLYSMLSPDSSIKKALGKTLQVPMKKALQFLVNSVVDEDTPYLIKARMVDILSLVRSSDLLETLSVVALNTLKEPTLNVHETQFLSNVISRIDAATLSSSLQKQSVWQLIITILKDTSTVAHNKDGTTFVPVLMMQQIDDEIFSVFPLDKAQSVISAILHSGTFGQDSIIISSASKLMKRIDLSSEQLLPELTSMLNISEGDETTTKRKLKTSAPSLSILNMNEWKRGVTLLEYLQNKKRLTDVEGILPILFNILKKCLDFEEQSAVEYTKQLLLTCILHCCQKICPVESKNITKIPNGLIHIELIVTCIRNTQNPQTHHHALMLLSHAAFMLPDQVLHHIMAIFTFIGSSVLRHDDAYSFQIITRIIETVIPILVRCKDISTVSDDELNRLEKRVIPVLRIFVDVVIDIPEHRRLPLFKKLLMTLSPEHFLWTFLSLIFEAHVMHGSQEHKSSNAAQRILADREQPIRRIDFAMALALEFSPEIIMQSCIKLITYLKKLPADKQEKENSDSVAIDPTEIFSIDSHSAKHLRHFKYTMITFINNILSSSNFIEKINSIQDKTTMENFYKGFIINILTYIQVVSKTADLNIGKPQAKYWKVMLHHSYEILDNINILLSPDMFIMVVRGLMAHNLPTVRRKSMEILNTKLQHQISFFTECDKISVYTLLDPLLNIISTINDDEIPDGVSKQEMELNQQTALLSLKLLVRLLAPEDPTKFTPILEHITDLIRSSLTGNLMASVILCLAELCSNLKAHAIAFLPKFMPPLIKILKVQNSAVTPELILVSIITAIHKIIETIPLFLSPYLEKILFEFALLSAKWEDIDRSNAKTSPVVSKLSLIMNKISSTIAPRVLIPVISQCHNHLLRKEKFKAIKHTMNILAESFSGISSSEFSSLQQDLTVFFMTALQFRSNYSDDDEMSLEQIDIVEGYVIKALVALVLKLSESSFRPLYFKIYDWALRAPNNEIKDRAITFYRLSAHLADNLKGLFVLFADHFVKNAAHLLDTCNKSKTDSLFFDSDIKCDILVENILKTLNAVFLYDCQNFVNKERFETIMQPLVDQLDNDICGQDALKKRAKELIIPCIAQFAVATADDSLWKPLNYQILLKTRHNDAHIRLLGLQSMCEMATKLGDSWLPLLPESVPFLAELLEDEVQTVEAATQKAVQTLEAVLGEPLQKYF